LIICEIHAAIHVLHAKNINAVEIHHQLCAVYSRNVMNEGTLRQWCRMFKDGRTNVHDEERNGQLAICSDQQMCERWRFTISELSCEYPLASRTVLYEIITTRLGYHKF
jgi:hypothetical protein